MRTARILTIAAVAILLGSAVRAPTKAYGPRRHCDGYGHGYGGGGLALELGVSVLGGLALGLAAQPLAVYRPGAGLRARTRLCAVPPAVGILLLPVALMATAHRSAAT